MVKSAVTESTPSMTMQRKSIKKRKATLKKKAEELAILCDAEVCMVISDEKAAAGTTEVIWPEDPAIAKAIMIKYKESSKRKQEVGVSGLVGSSKRKRSALVEEEEEKKGGNLWDEELDKLSMESLMDFSRALESKIGNVDERIRLLEEKAAIQVNYDHNHHDPLLIPDDFEFYSELDAMLKELEENDHHDPIVFNHNTQNNNLPLGFEEAHYSNYNINVCAPEIMLPWEISRFEAADDNFGLLGFDVNSINNINHHQLIPNRDIDVQPRMMGFNAADHQYMSAPEIFSQPSPSLSPLLEAPPMPIWPQPFQSDTTYQSFSHQF